MRYAICTPDSPSWYLVRRIVEDRDELVDLIVPPGSAEDWLGANDVVVELRDEYADTREGDRFRKSGAPTVDLDSLY